jgi:hypothetical protein
MWGIFGLFLLVSIGFASAGWFDGLLVTQLVKPLLKVT